MNSNLSPLSSPSAIPALHADFSARVDYVGNEKEPILIIDQFLENAAGLIDFAEAQGQFAVADAYYPGIRSPAPAYYIEAMYTHLRTMITSVFGLREDWVTGVKSEFSLVVTPPNALRPVQRVPHFDSNNRRELAMVHYLCDENKGGTSLYRHKTSGYEFVDGARMPHYRQRLNAELSPDRIPQAYMNGSTEDFEQIASISACFNRLVVYRCTSLHSGNIAPDFTFDPSPRTGRLTLNTFIYCTSL